MTRITYKKHPERDIYFSKQFHAGKMLLHATIIHKEDTHKFQVIINDLADGIMVYEQLCQDYNMAKRVVKNKFKFLGVKFDDEVKKKIDVDE